MLQTSPEIADLKELACSRCGLALQRHDNDLLCREHGRVGSCRNDYLQFTDDDTYWGEVERAFMQRIIERSRESSYQTALEELLRPHKPELLPYALHPSRADWNVLLPLDVDTTVSVDVGAGWGANSFGVAPHVHRHYAVEKIPERLEFSSLRKQQDGCNNIVLVRADLHDLPFAKNSIDVFIVNGVLEWAGLIDPDAGSGGKPRDPEILQKDFLRRLLALLRPGGWLYVGIENRYGNMFLRGSPDHQGLRFTSLMPRKLARAYTYARSIHSDRTFQRERDYRAYTYSFSGYKRLLQDTGFERIERYAVMPSYNTPTHLVPLEVDGPMKYWYDHRESPRRAVQRIKQFGHGMLIAMGLEKRMTSTYAITALKPI